MRVALNGLFLGRGDGTGRYTAALLRAAAGLAEAQDVDWQVITLGPTPVALPVPAPRQLTRAGLTPPSFMRRENPAKLWFEQWGVPAAARAAGADLLHYPYFAAPVRAGRPLVVTVHDLIPLLLPDYRGSPLVRAYMSLQSLAIRRARLILADSNASRHDVARLLDVPRQRVRVIYLGVDASFCPASEEQVARVRSRYCLAEQYLFHASGLDVRKNVERLILAYARARAAHGVTEPLAITGDPGRRGPLHRPLLPLVEKLELTEYVRFLGTVPEADLPALYSGCALAVVASLYEGFGLPVLEAMACGAPVACSTGGSLSEIAGDAALTFAPDDETAIAEALARGLQDTPLRARLREAGFQRARQFTWEKTATATIQAYRDALAT